MVEELLRYGADPTTRDRSGWTALHFAVSVAEGAGNADTVRALIRGGASVNAVANTGSTPLFIAAQNGHAAACALLCEAGASVHAAKRVPGGGSLSCLDIARRNGRTAVLRILEQYQARG